MRELAGMRAIVADLKDHGLKPMLEAHGMCVLHAFDADEALRLLSHIPTDFLFADALLSGMDGWMLIRRAAEMRTGGVVPAGILTCVAGFPTDGMEMPVLARPYDADALPGLLLSLLPENRRPDDERKAAAEALLTRLGVPRHIGRNVLTDAVIAASYDMRLCANLSARLYPALAERYGISPKQAERAVRHVIDKAWQQGSVEAQYELFGNTIDAQRGKPAVGAMIARCADILRLEVSK